MHPLRLLLFVMLVLVSYSLFAQDEASCPGSPPPRLTVGQEAFVLPGSANNMRLSPSTGAARVGQIPGEGVFLVIEGPECAEGYTWWRVNYEGILGWTVENSGEDYVLEPLFVPTPTPEFTPVPPTATPLPEFRIGADHVLWSADGSMIAVSNDAGVWLYNAAELDARPRLIAPRLWWALDRYPLTRAYPGYPGMWFRYHDPRMALSDDGDRLAVGLCLQSEGDTCTQGTVDIYDTATGERLRRYSGSAALITSVQFAPGERTLVAVGSLDTVVRLWNTQFNSVTSLIQSGGQVLRLRFSPDGAQIAIVAEYPAGIAFRVCEWESSACRTWQPPYDDSVLFNHDLSRWAFDEYFHERETGGRISIFDMRPSPQIVLTIPPLLREEGIAYVRMSAFSPDSRLLAMAHFDGSLRIWDLEEDREALLVEPGRNSMLNSLAFSPDGTQILSAGPEAVELRDVESGALLATLP